MTVGSKKLNGKKLTERGGTPPLTDTFRDCWFPYLTIKSDRGEHSQFLQCLRSLYHFLLKIIAGSNCKLTQTIFVYLYICICVFDFN